MIKNKWVQWVVIALPALALLGSGFSKLAGSEGVVKGLTALGVGPYITLIGVIEVTIVILYLVPATRYPQHWLFSDMQLFRRSHHCSPVARRSHNIADGYFIVSLGGHVPDEARFV